VLPEGRLNEQRSMGFVSKHALKVLLLCASYCCTSVYAADCVGSLSCEGCHQNEYQQWIDFDHDKSMQTATVESVLGNFSDISDSFHDIQSRFYSNDGETQIFLIKYTFGHTPYSSI